MNVYFPSILQGRGVEFLNIFLSDPILFKFLPNIRRLLGWLGSWRWSLLFPLFLRMSLNVGHGKSQILQIGAGGGGGVLPVLLNKGSRRINQIASTRIALGVRNHAVFQGHLNLNLA